jgi:hypothetical protein
VCLRNPLFQTQIGTTYLESLGLDDAADFPRLESMGIASSGISSLGPRTCAEDAQCNAAYNQHSADGRRDTLIMAGLYADVNVAGVKAVAFGLGDGNEQRCSSEHVRISPATSSTFIHQSFIS